jgi:hypothetical protein
MIDRKTSFLCQQRKALGEVEPHLVTEQRQRPRSSAIHLLDALVENPVHQVEILAHGRYPSRPIGYVQRPTQGIGQSGSDFVRLGMMQLDS